MGGSLGSIEKEAEERRKEKENHTTMGTLISRQKIYALCEYRSSIKLDVGGVRATNTTLQIDYKVKKITYLFVKLQKRLPAYRTPQSGGINMTFHHHMEISASDTQGDSDLPLVLKTY